MINPARRLAARRSEPRVRGLRQAVVDEVLTAPARVTVRVGGSATVLDEPLRYLESYTPTPGGGDTVWIAPAGDTWLVLGRVAV